MSTLSRTKPKAKSKSTAKKAKANAHLPAKRQQQPKPTQIPLPEGTPSNDSLLIYLRNKASQNAVRKLVSVLEECEKGQNEWGQAGINPCSRAYSLAIRALIQARRGDLVTHLWRIHCELSALPFNPILATAALRSALRDSNKRFERTDNVQYIYTSIKNQAEQMIAAAIDFETVQPSNETVEMEQEQANLEKSNEENIDDSKDPGLDEGEQETVEVSSENSLNTIQNQTQQSERGEYETKEHDADHGHSEIYHMASALANTFSAFYVDLQRGENVKDADADYAREALAFLHSFSAAYGPLSALKVSEYNELLRILGKIRDVDGLFDILDLMRANGVTRDSLTFEYLANAVVRQVRFVTGAVSMSTLPQGDLAEVAFVGRSNVGKSSLVNMICNRRALAYVSGRPGKTQQFNYFLVNELAAKEHPEQRFYMVDLPGVGYAKVPDDIQSVWLRFMKSYLKYRTSLRLVFHLVDGRHGPLNDDHSLMQQVAVVRGAFQYVIVLTKMDKTAKQRAKLSVINSTRQALKQNGCDENTPIVLTSASSKLGRDEMWRHLRLAVAPLRSNRQSSKH